ncbi:hypothetical protein [Streptomyces sp. NBC_00096]|uniref:hypothetical protein n=1 Tax=Streptomyces sp. NBC_00096 TaxID=2975650 RepID=UPI00324C1828
MTAEDVAAQVTAPTKVSELSKGGYVMLKGRACKIVSVDAADPRVNIVGVDLFSGKKYEEKFAADATVEVPILERTEYILLGISEDRYLRLIADDGDLNENVRVDDEREAKAVQKLFDENTDGARVTVFSFDGEERLAW